MNWFGGTFLSINCKPVRWEVSGERNIWIRSIRFSHTVCLRRLLAWLPVRTRRLHLQKCLQCLVLKSSEWHSLLESFPEVCFFFISCFSYPWNSAQGLVFLTAVLNLMRFLIVRYPLKTLSFLFMNTFSFLGNGFVLLIRSKALCSVCKNQTVPFIFRPVHKLSLSFHSLFLKFTTKINFLSRFS